jgi:hypothetical protein
MGIVSAVSGAFRMFVIKKSSWTGRRPPTRKKKKKKRGADGLAAVFLNMLRRLRGRASASLFAGSGGTGGGCGLELAPVFAWV